MEDYSTVVATVLRHRERDDTSYLSDVKRGISENTKNYAWAHIAPIVDGNDQELTALCRVAAIIALNPDAKQKDGQSLGQALHKLYQRLNEGRSPNGESSGSVVNRIQTLPMLDFERAAEAIDSLIEYLASEQIGVDFYDVAKTLLRWGNGISEESRYIRNRIIRDFYRQHENEGKDNLL